MLENGVYLTKNKSLIRVPIERKTGRNFFSETKTGFWGAIGVEIIRLKNAFTLFLKTNFEA